MPLAPTKSLTYTNTLPARNARDVRRIGLRLPGGVNYAAGTILGEQNIVTRNEVQTLTVTGTPTGGTVGSVVIDGVASAAIAYNATAAAVQTIMNNLIGAGNVTVTGGALPGTALVFTFGGDFGNRNVALMTLTGTALTGGTTPAAAITKTTTGSAGPTGQAAIYNAGASDGTQTPRYVLEQPVVTNARGMVLDEFGQEVGHTVQAAYRGEFFCADLPNLAAVVSGSALATLGKLTAGGATTDTGAILFVGV